MLEFIIKYLFLGFFEGLLLTSVGLGLLGIKNRYKNHLKIIPCYMIVMYLFDAVIDLKGLHPFVLLIILAILIKFIVKIDWGFSFIASLISFLILYISEVVFMLVVLSVFGLSIEQIQEPLTNFTFFYFLNRSVMAMISFIIYKFNINLIDLSGGSSG